MSSEKQPGREAVVAGPVAVAGLVFVLYGFRRGSPAALLLGGLALGAGLKITALRR